MSIENNLDVTPDVSLEDFSAEFFGQETPPNTPLAEDTASDETDEEGIATSPEEGDTQSDEDDDTLAPDDDDDNETDEEDDDEVETPQPKKKNRFQERINEFTRELRETQRQLAALKAENETLKQTPPATAPVVEDIGPSPEDTNEDGTSKYPLGEYDPLFIRDTARHTFKQEMEKAREEEARKSEQQKIASQREALAQEWTGKLAAAQERYPDLNEKGENLVSTFEGIDQAYGEYLTTTIMEMEYGPDVLYYLANHTDEAQRIVGLGPKGATLALGRIESKFVDASTEKRKAKPRVSNAPIPPPSNKGSSAAVVSVADDTEDLDAFSAKFFKKR